MKITEYWIKTNDYKLGLHFNMVYNQKPESMMKL